jgi:lipopolysaccharide transport system ATP-binding protein
VGDAQFQEKCLGKMRDVSAQQGRTVLFVSHNMQAIRALCPESILLRDGAIADRGPSWGVIERRLYLGKSHSGEAVWSFESAPAGGVVKLHSVRVCQSDGTTSYDQRCGAPITLSMEFWCLRQTKLTPSFHVYTQGGILVFPTGTLHVEELAQKLYEPGLHFCSCTIPEAFLNSGVYVVHAFLGRDTDGHAWVHVPEVVSFQVINDGTGQGTYTGGDWPGILRPLLPWTSQRLGELPG